MRGMRVCPPTSTTSSILLASTPASFNACLQGATDRLNDVITADGQRTQALGENAYAPPSCEQLVDDIIQRSVAPCKQALKDAGVDASKIDEVVLVGGQTRMPRISNS